jgi:hypothetical protein
MVLSIFKRDMDLRQIPRQLLIKQSETLADLKRKSNLIAALPQSFMIVSRSIDTNHDGLDQKQINTKKKIRNYLA